MKKKIFLNFLQTIQERINVFVIRYENRVSDIMKIVLSRTVQFEMNHILPK